METPERNMVGGRTTWGARSIAGDLVQTTLTPAQVRDYLLRAETGDIAAQAELFEKMEERDGELDGHLRTRKNGVSSLNWEIQPKDDTPAAADAADYAREVVGGIADIQGAIFDLLDAIGKGFSALEIEWQTSASEWRPIALHYRPQRWFQVADDGETLRLRDSGNFQGAELNPLNWIVHRVRARSGFSARQPLLRSLVRAFIVRHFAWKDWMGFAEVYGMPMRIGRLREGVAWDSDEAKQLESAVAAMGMDMYAVMREGNTIEILDAKAKAGEGEIFEKILDRASREMTLAILGQTLTSGGESGGSYALGEVHNQVRWDLSETDALSLDVSMSDQLLRPIIVLNKGESAPVPRWHVKVERPEDLEKSARTLKELGQAVPGLAVSRAWIYTKFGIPPAKEGDDTITLGPAPGGAPMFSPPVRPVRPVGHVGHTHGAAQPYMALNDASFRAIARMNRESPEAMLLWLNQAAEPSWRVLDRLALEFLGEKRIATMDAWNALTNAGKQRAWHVADLGPQPTAHVARTLTDVLRDGQTENEFLNRLEALGLSVPEGVEPVAGQIAAWHARLVHRNNRFGAQNAGQYLRLQQDRDVRPYGEWVCHSPCPICAPLCGHVAPLDSAFFNQYWPQIHHACQCQVVNLNADEIEREGLTVREDMPSPADADPQFVFHPGDAYYLESAGGAPATDAGRADADVLSALKRMEDYT